MTSAPCVHADGSCFSYAVELLTPEIKRRLQYWMHKVGIREEEFDHRTHRCFHQLDELQFQYQIRCVDQLQYVRLQASVLSPLAPAAFLHDRIRHVQRMTPTGVSIVLGHPAEIACACWLHGPEADTPSMYPAKRMAAVGQVLVVLGRRLAAIKKRRRDPAAEIDLEALEVLERRAEEID